MLYAGGCDTCYGVMILYTGGCDTLLCYVQEVVIHVKCRRL